MYRKRIFFMLLSIIIFAASSVGLSVYLNRSTDIQNMNSDIVNQSKNTVISRAVAAKMIALLFYSHDEIVDMPEVSKYADLNGNSWYDKYFYAVDELGFVWGQSDCRPQDNLTCGEAYEIYEYFMKNIFACEESTEAVSGGAEIVSISSMNIDVSDENISDELWMNLYEILGSMERTREMKRERVFLMSLLESDDDSWKIATDKGNYYFDGYAMDAYTNTTVEILTDGEEVVHIYGHTEEPATLNSVLITSYYADKVTILCNDIEAELTLSEDITVNPAEMLMPAVTDITVDKGIVTNMLVYNNIINSKILSVTDSYIDIQSYGRLNYASGCRFYNTCDTPRLAGYEDISVGYSVADTVVAPDGMVKAVLISKEIQADNIRVAITTTGHKSLYHTEVSLTSEAGFVVTDSAGSYEYKGGETFVVNKNDDRIINSRINITPLNGGTLTISSIKRSYGTPVYRGTIELTLYDEGIVIINELSLEQYLYAVVPSEMPSSYGIEPLKAQAVCARGYAYMQINNCKLGGIGAHVDDSTSYQVYNNTRETENAVAAVDATRGQVLQYNGKTISPYYFSTSCGSTADCNDVWYGMKHVKYLSGSVQDVNTKVQAVTVATDQAQSVEADDEPDMDLSDNKRFCEFINNPPCDTFDSSFPWYRWSVSLYDSDIRNSLEKSIESRYKANPKLILTKNKNGKYVSKKITTVGRIKSIKVSKRAKSGIIKEIVINGSEKSIKVISEYNIRLLLASVDSRITRNDNSSVDGLSILPSAFFYINTDTSSGQRRFILKGGGYGHGVGMSQNGAKAMADAGYDYTGILGHYYPGCSLSTSI